jgi:beta-N-acetylhexosaminidase
MVDCPSSGLTAATRAAITTYQVGSVILDGNNSSGVEAIGALTAQLQDLAPNYLGLFIATDQEGGLVQRLRGPGFTDIPAATEQGQEQPSQLQVQATVWGGALRAAGVNVDLGPVMDVVPVGFGSNPPIGDLDRQFGSEPKAVASHGVAVVNGLRAAGVDATVKHFPGLGRVHGNTDTTAGVTDVVTTENDPFLAPFRAAIRANVPFVMVSTAIYSRIDPGTPAAFSRRIVTGMLRTELGYPGVVVSDDLGNAAAVAGYSVADRALDFLAAGGDMVLTVDASQIPAMTAAVLAKAERDPAFRALVDAAVLRVLTAKQNRGLLG